MKFYRKLSLLLILLLCFTTAYAQSSTPSGTCTDIMQKAMAAVSSDCAPTGRNQACYGYVSLQATPRTGRSEFHISPVRAISPVWATSPRCGSAG